MTTRLKIESCNTHHRSVEADSIQTIIQWSTWGELKWAKSHTLLSKPKSTFQKKKINGQIQLGQSFWQRKSLILSKLNSSLFNFEISCKHLHISVSFFATRIVWYSSVFNADKDTESSQVYCIIIKISFQNLKCLFQIFRPTQRKSHRKFPISWTTKIKRVLRYS